MNLPPARTVVPPSGHLDSSYVLVGEQPGRDEIKTHRPFTGPAGQELDKDLATAQINRAVCYMTNVIKDLDRHKDAYVQLYKGKTLLKSPIVSPLGQQHLDFLRWELEQTSAKVFGAVGAVALFALTGKTGINKWRGSILDCTLVEGRKVVPLLHPATVIKPKYQFLNRRLISFDLKRLNEVASNLYVPSEREIMIEPSFYDAMNFLHYCRRKGIEGNRVSYDIEVFMSRVHKHVSCIAFAVGLKSMCIPFVDWKGDYFVKSQEAEIWRLIAEILEDPKIRIVAQNAVFDCHFLLRTLGIRANNLDDTMIAQNIILPDYPKGLHFITSIFTDHPYYKDDGKDFIGTTSESYKRYWIYNATDAVICSESMPKQAEELGRLDDTQIYRNQVKIIGPLVYMMERGIRVDVEGMKQMNLDYERKIETAQINLNKIAGEPLNANSNKQLYEHFCIKKKIKPYTKNRKPTFDDDAIKRLKRRGFEEAKWIKEIRRLVKLRSTYLDIGKIDTDRRFRCSYNPAGTRFSRLSSSKNIWGVGGNSQNWPHKLQEFLLPDVGYVYYAFDLEQAENRIVANVGEIVDMIECFETGRDVHSRTALMIMNVFYGGKIPEDVNVRSKSPLGDGTHSWRFYGKKSNHGFNYDLGYKNFALVNELAENDGRMLYNAYHKLYPGVQQGFQAYVRFELRKKRMLTNLMGRQTLFMGALNGPKADNTFKESYACIPQGTVGDIVNERGLNYIYDDQENFGAVELLRQVHDEIGFQIPLSVPWNEHARMLVMIKKSLEVELTTHNGRKFTIPAGLTMGKTLNKSSKVSCKEVKNITVKTLKENWRSLNEKNA